METQNKVIVWGFLAKNLLFEPRYGNRVPAPCKNGGPRIMLDTSPFFDCPGPLFVDQPIQYIGSQDSFIIRDRILIQSEDQLGIVVFDASQRTQFPLQGHFIPDGCRYLIIHCPMVALARTDKKTAGATGGFAKDCARRTYFFLWRFILSFFFLL